MTRRVLAAAAVAAAVFPLYLATLLPGVDFGDTPSFQVMAGAASISPRDAYPLYFAIGDVIVWLRGGDAAHALNLASAIEAALASGVFVLVAMELTGSIAAAVGMAFVFAGSYTFWSQAIIAEVYALHVLIVGLTTLAILSWDKRPTTARLALFFALYAVGFGNHLTMILLLPAYALFMLAAAPGGWRSVARARTVAMAMLCATMGALQYAWNLRDLWLKRVPPATLVEGLRIFWFDVTKADWRQTIVLELPRSMVHERFRMYGFDLRQQFGWIVPLFAVAGIAWLARRSRSRAVLIGTAFGVNFAFAFGYSVGDVHVFFLPSHYFVALSAACGIAWLISILERTLPRRTAALTAGLALGLFAGSRIYDTYPALDRSSDHRPVERLQQLTRGLDDRRDVLLVDLNWQVENGLNYFATANTYDVAYQRLANVLPYAPAFVRDNRAIGRNVVLSNDANRVLVDAYGPAFDTVIDERVQAEALSATISRLPPGTRYVLTVLKPTGDNPIDTADLARALTAASGGEISHLPDREYFALAGFVGHAPLFVRDSNDPFRVEVSLDSVPVTIRMDAWLAFDTIRRMGFGHVIANRRHTLIVERGVSFAAFDEQGRPLGRAYAGDLFAPEPRYRITRAMVEP